MDIGSAGRALLYNESNTSVPPSPAKITRIHAANVVKPYIAAFATKTE